MKKTTEHYLTNEDAILLQKEMDRIISGDFEPVDISAFKRRKAFVQCA